MQHLRRLLGLRERDEGLSIILLISFLFLLILSLLSSCLGSFSPPHYEKTNLLPSANAPIVRSDLAENNIQFTGTAAIGQRIDIFIDDAYLATTSADNIGQWYYEGAIDTDGLHTLVLKAKLDDGSFYTTTALPFAVDLAAITNGESLTTLGSSVEYLLQQGEEVAITELAAPTIDGTRDGRTVETGSFTINGNGVAGRKVRVFANGTALGLATVTNTGTWSYPTDLPNIGDYTFRAEDAELSELNTGQFSVNVLPAIQRPTLEIISGRDHFNDIPLAGTGEPNTTLSIVQNGVEIGLTDVDTAGSWVFDAPRVADVSDYTFIATTTSNVQLSSITRRIQFEYTNLPAATPDPIPAVAAAITLATPVVDLANLSFTNGVANGALPLGGTAAPNGSRILLFFEDEPFGETNTNNKGEWQLDTGIANLAPGRYKLDAHVVDNAGTLLASDTDFIIIPDQSVATIDISEITLDLAAITIDADGNASGTTPLAGDGSPANARVKLFLDGVELGETTINADGTYNLPWEWALAAGTYQLTAQIIDDADAISAESNTATLIIPELSTTLQVVYSTLDNASASDRLVEDAPTVELIFDASWSMTLPTDSDAEADRLTADNPDSRVSIARESLLDVIATLPEGVPVALRAFGNRAEPLGCQTDLEVALAPLDRAQLSAVITAIEPQFNANTHIAASLNAIPADLADAEGAITVILLTDGKETCGGNPAAAIANLRNQGVEIVVDVVGFAINSDALRNQFVQWAEIGGGQYYDASDADGLSSALELAFRPKYRVLDADGAVVAIGAVGSERISLPSGNYTVEMLTGSAESYPVTVGPFATVLEVE